MKRYYLRFFGRVQGVGFRYFVYENASRMNLTGYVRNLTDGSVEAEIQGEGAFIDELRNIILRGNRYIKVARLEIKEINSKEKEKNFEMLY